MSLSNCKFKFLKLIIMIMSLQLILALIVTVHVTPGTVYVYKFNSDPPDSPIRTQETAGPTTSCH